MIRRSAASNPRWQFPKSGRKDEAQKGIEEGAWASGARPFWEGVLKIGASVPEEEWEKVPRDLSINLDHYLYGAPKDEEAIE